MFEPTPIEKPILQDVKLKTGFDFLLLDSIPVREKAVADAVLPVLLNWVSVTEDDNHRHALYACFHTPHARKHFDQLVSWWLAEPYELALSSLTQTITDLVRAKDAQRIWSLCKGQPKSIHHMLIAKLATVRSPVQMEIKDWLVELLQSGQMPRNSLQYIWRIDEPRIKAWFINQRNSPDPLVRVLSKKLALKSKPSPGAIHYTTSAPDRSREIFSTEVDLNDLQPFLTKLFKDLGLTWSSPTQDTEFLFSAKSNRWLEVTVLTDHGRPASIWFRLEDEDTVEIVVTTEAPVQ